MIGWGDPGGGANEADQGGQMESGGEATPT